MAAAVHTGGGFNPPEPTDKGGPDYGRFIEAVRDLQDRARAADAPDDVITQAADLLEQVSELLKPYDADEWTTPSGRRMDLPMRGSILIVPNETEVADDGRLRGWVRFRRYHLGRNGAVHGGFIAHLFDSVLGKTSILLTGGSVRRTAYLHVNYRKVVPIEKELQVDAAVVRADGRKVFVDVRLCDGDDLLADGEGLFVQLKPGQP
jgi:acyl-coenzyme A thioesterase PaaI-like protein